MKKIVEMTKINYRRDIDGLRAIAVLFVLGFHLFPKYFPGGFIGVDIFFVISGFLITTIVIDEYEKDKFSILNFYSRRVKRIFPALLIVLVSCLVIGWFTLLSEEYSQLNKHIFGGASFISNILFWQESGYFDKAADTKPLLHLWSLGIEEQFYIIWPLILWIVWRLRLKVLPLLVALGLCSFVLNVYKVGSDPTTVFYLPITRFWELCFGGCLAIYILNKKEQASAPPARLMIILLEASAAIGLALIFYGLFFLSDKNQFPGYFALIPVVGSLLLISSGKHSQVSKFFFNRKVLIWIGLISFPLYLWHWPIYSFVRILNSQSPSNIMCIGILLGSILLAYLTYRFIEKPVRSSSSSAVIMGALILGMIALILIGYAGYIQNGYIFREVVKINTDPSLGFDGGIPSFVNSCNQLAGPDGSDQNGKSLFTCFVDGRSPPRYALVGDSKAGALIPGLFRTSSQNNTWIFFGSSEAKPLVPVLGGNPIYEGYSKKSVNRVLEILRGMTGIETVVVGVSTRALFRLENDYSIEDLPSSKNYKSARDGFEQFIQKLLEQNKKVMILIDNPTLPHPEDCLHRKTSIHLLERYIGGVNKKCTITIEEQLRLSKQYRELIDYLEKKYPNQIESFDTLKFLCDSESGNCPSIQNGRPLYGVSDHISDFSSGKIGDQINTVLNKASGNR